MAPVLWQEKELDDRVAVLAFTMEDAVANERAAIPHPVYPRPSLPDLAFVANHVIEFSCIQKSQIRDLVDRCGFDLNVHKECMTSSSL